VWWQGERRLHGVDEPAEHLLLGTPARVTFL
jgi:hypothetical protein